ncbi:unnamed protein product [Spirodela intermedia]|uniref:DNA helicase n=1 Tax=Spirodela intermedia TaxID=51605 RepID=A0A7I8J4D9_SPIIN|nr:unnamed protein product [Spirodela intermedia]CAA6665108.1 unnamed protein product [Spirodela intermedia]
MASKGPRSRLDPESRSKRQKALEAPKEPPRQKTHWDYVLEEMVWLSKDFESERKWKLSQAKKVAVRASKNMLDQATKGEKKVKEEEQRLRKIAINISKDVKKFWIKIEKLVLYKHQLELEEKKKKVLDKQLDFLLGQTERYSTMLAENLMDKPHYSKSELEYPVKALTYYPNKEDNEGCAAGTGSDEIWSDAVENDDDYGIQSEDDMEDDEHTLEEDEALITEEERKDELAALQNEVDIPIEEILKRYQYNVSMEDGPENAEDLSDQSPIDGERLVSTKTLRSKFQSRNSTMLNQEHLPLDSIDEMDDGDFVGATEEEKDDETTLSEEEELAKKEVDDPLHEIELLQRESEMPIEELLATYKKPTSSSSDDTQDSAADQDPPWNSQVVSNDNYSVEKVRKTDIEVSQIEVEDMGVKPNQDLENGKESEDIIADAAAAARSAQPTGNTFSTTKVRTKLPFLLKHPLREYQHIGLDWLVTMYEKRLNGILADEMGLGKTIMTISLLAHLACEKGIWGPHLIVVPTSVMLNWETEFLKWCPAFKILTYFGSAKERKNKRQGWLKPNSFHICITTYRLVIQDSKVFKRKKWKYLILDEAHLIKNWKSQRWQTLLNFNSRRRILLTGTPLQNDLMELWSLMHFLMPHIFQSHQEFKDWFSNPITGMVEGQEKVNKEVVDRLHNVLRPFILRRLKRDVEKQLPRKHEHVIYCRLSRRQRNLYEDFIASSETQATLASANFFGMISVIMQLRKVCNHPDLFEGRPIISSFDMSGVELPLSSAVCTMLSVGPFSNVDIKGLNLLFSQNDYDMTSWEFGEVTAISGSNGVESEDERISNIEILNERRNHGANIFEAIHKALLEERAKEAKERAASIAWWNSLRCQKKPMYGTNLRDLITIKHPVLNIHEQRRSPSCYLSFSSKLSDIVLLPVERLQNMLEIVESFMFAIPAARAPSPLCWCSKGNSPVFLSAVQRDKWSDAFSPLLTPVRPAIVRRQVYFPDRRLIQFDCGKLQKLAVLLRRLKSEGHRALIFTQMTKMLDILEAFINLYGYTYLRLDGSTQPEERQTLMQRFNTNPKLFLFILSTRSGGVGINLVGADTVIFYDSDWNPAMDQQAQDRCHRIGQTREVHIYRLISERTIEENILKKANQKRALDDLVIQSGSYNTEFFKKLDPLELFSGHQSVDVENLEDPMAAEGSGERLGDLSNADVEAALKQAEDEVDYMALKKVELEEAVENQEFTEEAISKLEDDELVNEDDVKADELPISVNMDDVKPDKKTSEQNLWLSTVTNLGDGSAGVNLSEENVLFLGRREEDIDMLADVKQLAAAAAAAGQASSSFENQLRPIDRYAMRFLDLWDPIIDKSAIEAQDSIEGEEWELNRIERFKDDLEAEIDEDEEPLLYERWDADIATEAYRQHVEALAQQQMIEELECESEEANAVDDVTKEGSLTTESEAMEEGQASDLAVENGTPASPQSLNKRKRKEPSTALEDEKHARKGLKKPRRASENGSGAVYDKQVAEALETRSGDEVVEDLRPSVRTKIGGKVSITVMPVKRVMVVKPEKLKKRGNIWSKDCIPSPDAWSSQEDAVLCAVVHEYSTNWSLVSDALYSMPAGGLYRGIFRHPVHCCERFRELFFKYVSCGADGSNSERIASSSFGKALLKVTEDQVAMLLNVASEQPDMEFLLQKHFTAILSLVWRARFRGYRYQRAPLASRSCLEGEDPGWPRQLSRGPTRPRPSKHRPTNDSLKPPKSKIPRAAAADPGGEPPAVGGSTYELIYTTSSPLKVGRTASIFSQRRNWNCSVLRRPTMSCLPMTDESELHRWPRGP